MPLILRKELPLLVTSPQRLQQAGVVTISVSLGNSQNFVISMYSQKVPECLFKQHLYNVNKVYVYLNRLTRFL